MNGLRNWISANPAYAVAVAWAAAMLFVCVCAYIFASVTQ